MTKSSHNGFCRAFREKVPRKPVYSLNHGRLILFSFLAWPSSSFSLFASVVILRPACPREKPTEGNEGNEESKDRCFGVLEEFCRAPSTRFSTLFSLFPCLFDYYILVGALMPSVLRGWSV